MQILANNPLAAQQQQNQNQQQQNANSLTQAQIPGIQAETQQRQLQNQAMQRQMQDQAALTEAWKNSFGQPPSDFQSQGTSPGTSSSAGSSSQPPTPAQQLAGVTDQNSYDHWRANNPGYFAPEKFYPDWVQGQTQGVTAPPAAQSASGSSGSQPSSPQATAQPNGMLQNDRYVEMLQEQVRAGKLSAQGYQAALADHMTLAKNSMALSKDQSELLQTSSNKAGAALEAYDNLPDAQKTPENWGKTYTVLQANSPVPLDFSPDQLPTPAQIQMAYGRLNYLGQIGKDAQIRADAEKAQAGAAKATQDTLTARRAQDLQDLSAANITDQPSLDAFRAAHPAIQGLLPAQWSPVAPQIIQNALRSAVPVEKQPEYQQQQDFLTGTSSQVRHSRVDAIATDPNVRKMGYGLVDSATNLQSYQQALEKVAQAQQQIDFETNPQVQRGKVQVAGAEGQARAAADLAAQREQYAGSPLANVPPHLVQAATADYQKATNDYLTARQAADDMQTFIGLERQGNKVAYSYSPVEGVLTLNTGRGVKRVNMSEISSYEGAGSLADHIQAWLGKHVSGASIPPDILNDMDQLHQAVADNAQTAYERKVQSNRYTYNSNFQPQKFQSSSPQASPKQSAAPALQPGQWVKLKNGKTVKVTAVHPDGSFDAN